MTALFWKTTAGILVSVVLKTLMKITGIGIVSELVQMICKDSGNSALAQMMHLLGTSMILLLSQPILEALLDLVQQILGAL